MEKIDIEAFKKEWFTFEEIESIKRSIDDVENNRVFTEDEFYSRINKKLFSKNTVNV